MRMDTTRGSDLSEKEIEARLKLLREGGAIHYFKTAREGLESALAVVSVQNQWDLVGLGALKCLRLEYLEKIEERYGWTLTKDMREIGYIVVRESHRGEGLSKHIVKEICAQFPSTPMFATTSSLAMMATFRSAGFYPQGHPYHSKEGKELTLWVKE